MPLFVSFMLIVFELKWENLTGSKQSSYPLKPVFRYSAVGLHSWVRYITVTRHHLAPGSPNCFVY
jgi:hypothetical protein